MLKLVFAILFVFAAQDTAQISGVVQDENDQPVSNAEVVLHSATTTARTSTDDLGKFRFEPAPPGPYTLEFNRTGFFKLTDYSLDAKPRTNEIMVTLNHETEIRSKLDVLSSAHEIVLEQMRYEQQLAGYEIRENPVPNSHDLQSALPALPGVVQDTTGQLHVAGARQEQTLYTLDGFQINNAATGAFDARVNVDAVREADMSTGRYGAQYSNGATGVLAIQTDTGDDHRKFGITNFFPALSTQRGVQLGNFYPRVTYSGPIKPGRAWFAEAATLEHDFTLVRELPPGGDISQTWSLDNLMRVQYNVTPSHSLQGNFLYNYSTATRVGLNALAPAETTFDTHSHLYFLSARDQITIKNGLIDIGIASDTNHGDIVPQGTQSYALTPTGPLGNYFLNQVQNTRRWQGLADAILSGRKWHGSHDLRFGWNIQRTHMGQVSTRQPVQVEEANTAVVREASFIGNGSVASSVTQGGAYAQDAWQLTRDVIFQSTLRVDWNDFIHRPLPQPRFVLSWTPDHSRSKISLGWGLYYQPIYPVLLGQASDQIRQDLVLGPQQNVTSSLLTSFQLAPGLRQPFFNMTSVEWERQWNGRTSSSISFMHRQEHHGLSYGGTNATFGTSLQLSDQRADRYDSAEFTLRRTLRPGSEVMVDYTYSRARSNQIFTYSVENLVLANQAGGRLPWDTPNRVISRGAFPTKRGGLLLTYFGEYHTGFPFSAVDSRFAVVGMPGPDSSRFPSYFSLNTGVEKRFPFYRRQWALRLAVVNMTGHRNPNTVVNSVDASNFGTFAGGQSRALTFRLRLVGQSESAVRD
jgi:hypothetical protein